MENPNFLKNKYDLHNAPETESAAKRTEKRTGEKVPQGPEAQIQNYLDRFSEIIERKEPAKRERGIEALKKVLHDKFIIKPEEIPESYFETQQRLAREQGHGDIEISEELRSQLTEVIITDQKSSLDNWIDYLASDDATYPDWLKYYAFRSILGMGDYDKEKKQFTKRSKGTVKPFPDINREALAYVLDAIEKKTKREKINIQTQSEEEKKEFNKLLQSENFAKLYAFAIDKVTPATESALANIKGEWVKYRQGRDHMPLVNSLQGRGTGWCTAGESTANAQLENGDFYVYYSYDENKKLDIPRAAIRMQGGNIAEIRGIAPDQNLDPFIGDIVKEKLKEFPDGQAYEKKSADMKLLTEIEKKTQSGQELSKNELFFLYEIDSPIEGFGYQRDPRIKEIRESRKIEKDVPIVFECDPSEIAYGMKEIAEKTKAYIGEWNMEIFQKIRNYPNIKYLFESFPDKKIFMQNLETDPDINSPKSAEEAMERKNIYRSDWGKDILYKTEFSQEKQNYDLVRFTVSQLGFPSGATTQEIYDKAEKLGLELCPAEVGPHLRLQYPGKEWMLIAMKQISGRYDCPDVFNLRTDGVQLGLHGSPAEPENGWDADFELVFRFRKKEA